MTAVVIKNKRSQTLFRRRAPVPSLQVTCGLSGVITPSTLLSASLESPTQILAGITSAQPLQAVVLSHTVVCAEVRSMTPLQARIEVCES